MQSVLLIIVAACLAVDGFLNISSKPNLGQLLLRGQPIAVQRYGSATLYFGLAAICIYLGWFAK